MWEAVLSGGLEGGRGGYDIRVSLMLRSSSNSSNDLRERERERERERDGAVLSGLERPSGSSNGSR